MATQEEQLVDLLADLDEALIIKALERAAEKRMEKGLGPDLIEALRAKGIKVRLVFAEKPFYKSKKFWGGVIALAIILADTFVPQELWRAALPALAYIFGQGLADLGKNRPGYLPPQAV